MEIEFIPLYNSWINGHKMKNKPNKEYRYNGLIYIAIYYENEVWYFSISEEFYIDNTYISLESCQLRCDAKNKGKFLNADDKWKPFYVARLFK